MHPGGCEPNFTIMGRLAYKNGLVSVLGGTEVMPQDAGGRYLWFTVSITRTIRGL